MRREEKPEGVGDENSKGSGWKRQKGEKRTMDRLNQSLNKALEGRKRGSSTQS